MKKSRIMLMAGAAFVLIILLTLITFFRVKADSFISFANNPEETIEISGIIESQDFNFKNYDTLKFESLWNVIISEGSDYKITITADKALLNQLDVSQSGDVVSFSYDKYLRGGSGSDNQVTVNITMPDLEGIEFSGLGNIELKNFDLDNLEIINSGASNFEAENVRINQLNMVISGAANAELSNIEIVNCHLNISGAANIELNMNGGILSGQVSGAASVVYRGTVSDESVTVSGIGSLKKM